MSGDFDVVSSPDTTSSAGFRSPGLGSFGSTRMGEVRLDGRRGWWVVAGCFLTLCMTSGLSFFVFPVAMVRIIPDTGWRLEQVALGATIWGLSAAALSPVCGMLIDRFGPRRAILFGIVYSAGVAISFSRVETLAGFYLLMGLAPFGAMLSTYIPVGAVVARWFVRYRGISQGVAMLGTGLGGALFPLLAAALLEAHGWRETYFILGVFELLALIPAWILVRTPTAEDGIRPGTGAAEDSKSEVHLSIGQVLRTGSFWTLGLGDALSGLVYAIFGVLSVVFLTMDLGNEKIATRVFSTLQFFIAVGTLPLGFLADRLDFRRLFVACYFVPALATMLLLVRGEVGAAFVFAVVAGLAAGGRSALFPMALARTFGASNVGLVWGWINSVFMLGTAVGPLLGSVIVERSQGSTRALYLTCIGILVISSTLVALAKREVGSALPVDRRNGS